MLQRDSLREVCHRARVSVDEAAADGDVPTTPWMARVLPTSLARRTRRSSSKTWGDEPQQLARWAEHLHQELLQMTQERDNFSRQLAEERSKNSELQTELERLRTKSAQFERSICGGFTPDTALTENCDLKTQLTSLTEAGQLRAERDSLQESHARSQQIVQQLHAEREELRARHKELLDEHEHSKANCSRLLDLHGSERLQRQRLESQLQSQGQNIVAEANRQVKEELLRAQQSSQDQGTKLEAVFNLAQEAIAIVTELQDAFVQQIKNHQELSRSVRRHEARLIDDMNKAQKLSQRSEEFSLELQQLLGSAREANSAGEEEWKQEAHKLEEKVRHFAMHHREAAKAVREFRQEAGVRKTKELESFSVEEDRRKLKIQRDGQLRNPNIMRQMAQAMDGLEVSKVDERNRMQKRRLRVLCDVTSDQGGLRPELQLQWSKAPYKEWRARDSCDLSQVVRVGYGFASRAAWLFAVPAHRCFSVCTPYSSLDFVCNSDSDVEAFVLVVSRLCTRSQGWPVYGAVHSHSRFVAMKGWTKIEAACRASKNTLSTHLLEAVSKIPRRQLPPPPRD